MALDTLLLAPYGTLQGLWSEQRLRNLLLARQRGFSIPVLEQGNLEPDINSLSYHLTVQISPGELLVASLWLQAKLRVSISGLLLSMSTQRDSCKTMISTP